MVQRLPIVNSDDGTWGDILRNFLLKEHYDTGVDSTVNGGHKTVTIQPGTAAAGTAPLKFSSGTLLTTPEAGAVEFNTDSLYFTQTTSTTRKKIAAYDDGSGATGDIYYRDASGYFVRLGVGGANTVLTSTGTLPSWGTIGLSSLSASAYNTTPTASTLAEWDANKNLSANTFIQSTTSTATAAAITTLTIASSQIQIFTGTTTQTVKLPTTSVTAGQTYTVINQSTGAVTVQSSGGNQITILAGSTFGVFTADKTTPTAAADWSAYVTANGKALTTNNSLTLAGTDGKTLTVNNNLTLSGTDATTMTFPSTSATIARTDAAQTFTGVQTFSSAPSFSVLPTGSGVASAATASTLMSRDANKNTNVNAMFQGFTTTATAAGTTALTITSTPIQVFTGSSTQTVTLPTTSVPAGAQYIIINQSTGAVTVQSSGANTITVLAGGTSGFFTAVVATPTTAANWNSQYLGQIITSGKSLSVSNTLTLAGTDSTTMTFPSTSATIARTDAAQTFTGVQTFSSAPSFGVLPTGSGVASTATASTLAARDGNALLTAKGYISGFSTTATAATTTTLTIASNAVQEFTGTTTQTVLLPTTSVVAGAQYTIINNSTGAVTVQSSGANTISTMSGGTTATFTALIATPTTAANWDSNYVAGGGDASTNTSTSVDSEVTLFNGTTGKSLKRATGTGIAKLTSGVLSTVTAPTGAIVGDTDTQTLSGKTLTAPKIVSGGFIADANGNAQIIFNTTASAVNQITINNASTGGSPKIQASGGDANLPLSLQGKGATGYVQLLDSTGAVQFATSASPATTGVNYPFANNANTGGAAVLGSWGADTNVDLNLTTKGTGLVKANGIEVATISGTQTLTNKTLTNPQVTNIVDSGGRIITKFSSLASTSNYNYIALVNRDSGGTPYVAPDGFDTNIDMVLQPKGTGGTVIYANSQNSMALSVTGSQTNIDFNLVSKGTGVVKANGVEIPTVSTASGMLRPVRVGADTSSLTYTIVSGTVTQIAGTTIDGVSVAVGDRVMISGAPASSGAGSNYTNQPGNGVYVVTAVSSNISLVRASDMSGSAVPWGVGIPIREGTRWGGFVAIFNGTGAFTWGTTALQMTGYYRYDGIFVTNPVDTALAQTLTNKTLTTPKVDAVNDTNGNNVLVLDANPSPVNYVALGNWGTGGGPYIETRGSDSNVDFTINAKGSGGLALYKTTGQTTAKITATGVDANIDLNLTTKGTGIVKANGLAVATKDSNGSIAATNFNSGYTTTVTSGGTLTLTAASTYQQWFTGSSNHTVVLPVTSTMSLGQCYFFYNNSNGAITVNASDGSNVFIIAAAAVCPIYCVSTTDTSANGWVTNQLNVWADKGKAGVFNNTLILAGTDGTTMTFPNANDTVVGAAAAQTLTNKTLSSPKLSGNILDSNGNILIENGSWSASAVNYLHVESSPVNNWYVALQAKGGDTDISLSLIPKGAGSVQVQAPSGSTPTISSWTSDTNTDLNLTTKGTGVVKANGVAIARKYTATIGDGSTTAIVVTHNLGTQDCTYSIRDASTNTVVDCDVAFTSTSQATFTFSTAPATNAYKVVIIG